MHDEEHIIREFDRLIGRHRKLIEALCQRGSYGQPYYCRELLQECYVELLSRLPERESGSSLMPEGIWVFWRCRNAITRYWRKVKRFPSLLPDELLPDVDRSFLGVTQLAVEDLAACLDDEERTCFLLMAEGTPDKEIERMLGLKHRSLIQMRHNIKVKLKKYIEQ